MEMDEAQILQRCQNGELEYFGLLFDAYYKKIYNFIYYRTHHKETAEDVASLVFTKALEKIESFNPKKAGFSTWLYQIARNSIIDHYRTAKSTDDIENAFDLPSSSNIERDADTRAQLEKVKAYLEELPVQQRDIVIMRVWDGLSHKEIAEVLGISEANSKMTYSRVMGKLNKEVQFAVLLLLALRIL
jgi:RNA polymerase sigma-70 factor, ECF subfamily